MSDDIYKLLDNSLDCGLTEQAFWEMTLAEIERYLKSRARIKERESQEKASFDYILADLIGRSVGRVYGGGNMPEIYDIYPNLFSSKEIEEQRQAHRNLLSALRFKEFANFHNKKAEVAK